MNGQPSRIGNEAAQKALREQDRRLHDFELAALEGILSTESGRLYLYRLIYIVAGLENNPCNHDVKDGACAGLHSWFASGMSEVGRRLKAEIQDNFPRQWVRLIDEQVARAEKATLERERILNKAEKETPDDD